MRSEHGFFCFLFLRVFQELRYRDELKTFFKELRDQDAKRLRCRGVSRDIVVKEEDIPVPGVLEYLLHDDVDRRMGPVAGIDRPADEGVIPFMRRLHKRIAVTSARRTQKVRPVFEVLPDRAFASVDLAADRRIIRLFQIDMGIRMIPELMSFPRLSLDDLRIPFGILADQEEGCLHMIFPQDVEDLVGAGRMRPVVEGQSALLLPHGAGVDHVRRACPIAEERHGCEDGEQDAQRFPHSSSRVPKRYPISFH